MGNAPNDAIEFAARGSQGKEKEMTRIRLWGILASVAVVGAASVANAGWGVGVSIGLPVYGGHCYHPCYHHYYPYYYYRPYAPVIVEPAPTVVVPSVQVVSPPPTTVIAPAPVYQAPAPSPLPALDDRQADIDRQLTKLRDPSEQVRADAVLQLGRLRADRSIDQLDATLAGDASPAVRESAARALGLIGSQRALPALQRAAQVDSSAQVRSSAAYAIEVIHSR
jgi:hypothetical protein